MKTSDSIAKIAPALLAAQKAITFAAKNNVNPHFRNSYADLPSVIDAIKSALNENGIAFLQTGTPSADNCLHLTTRLLHESGEWIEDTAQCPLPKADPQGFGSAMTYLRRYSLSAICGLYQEDDDGEGAKPSTKTEAAPRSTKPAGKAKPALSAATVEVPWRDYAIHFGKNKGVLLGQLEEDNLQSLAWYCQNWKPRGDDQADVALRAAFDRAQKELAIPDDHLAGDPR